MINSNKKILGVLDFNTPDYKQYFKPLIKLIISV